MDITHWMGKVYSLILYSTLRYRSNVFSTVIDINFINSYSKGKNIHELQDLMGKVTLEMPMRYARIYFRDL